MSIPLSARICEISGLFGNSCAKCQRSASLRCPYPANSRSIFCPPGLPDIPVFHYNHGFAHYSSFVQGSLLRPSEPREFFRQRSKLVAVLRGRNGNTRSPSRFLEYPRYQLPACPYSNRELPPGIDPGMRSFHHSAPYEGALATARHPAFASEIYSGPEVLPRSADLRYLAPPPGLAY